MLRAEQRGVGPGDHAPLHGAGPEAADGEHAHPQQRRHGGVPGHGGGAGQRQLSAERHCQSAAAEPQDHVRRGQFAPGDRPRAL